MAKFNLGLMVLVLSLCAIGCNGGGSDLSPDGNTVAKTNNDSVTFHDVVGKRPDITIHAQGVGSPRFSPDGKLLAVEAALPAKDGAKKKSSSEPPQQTMIIDPAGTTKFTVPDMVGPYAWKPDGTELLGVHGKKAVVLHIGSHEIVREYLLPKMEGSPQVLAWLGQDRDIALGGPRQVIVIHGGVVKSHAAKGNVIALAYDAAKNRLIWVESSDHPVAKYGNDPYVSVNSIGLDVDDPTVILPPTNASNLMVAKGHEVMLTSASISPDGTQLAVAGIAEDVQPEQVEKANALKRSDPSGTNKKVQKELADLDKEMRINSVCTTTPLDSVGGASTVRFSARGMDLLVTPHWIGGGHTLDVVQDDRGHKLTRER